VRLNRFLAGAGLGSRRACEELIRQGRIEVNGVTVTLPGPEIDPAADDVRCDGERVRLPKSHLYLMLNKPAGFVTTLADERGRKSVADFLGRYLGKVFPVGRLDRATEGLLLLTSDGELANRLLHPRYQVERTYMAWVRPIPSLAICRQIEAGVAIGDGERSGPADVRVYRSKGEVARVRLILREGKYREVRRIFAHFDIKVNALRRVAFAGLTLGTLEPGHLRALTAQELTALRRRAGLLP